MSVMPETTKGHDVCRSPLVWMDGTFPRLTRHGLPPPAWLAVPCHHFSYRSHWLSSFVKLCIRCRTLLVAHNLSGHTSKPTPYELRLVHRKPRIQTGFKHMDALTATHQ